MVSKKRKEHGKNLGVLGPAAKKQKRLEKSFDQLKKDNDAYVLEIDDLKENIKDQTSLREKAENLNESLKTKVEDLAKKVDSIEGEIEFEKRSHSDTKKKLGKFADETFVKEEKLERINEEMSENLRKLALKPASEANKKYHQLSQPTKNKRCETVLECIQTYVGTDEADIFIVDFVKYVSKHRRFKFRTRFTTEETFCAVIKFRLSDGFLKSFKSFSQKTLGFDIFGSRKEVDEHRKKLQVHQEYEISIESSTTKTRIGREIPIQNIIAVCKNVPEVTRRRLETLSANDNLVFDEGIGDDIIISADTGDGVTKVCMSIENCQKPNSSLTETALGWYTGTDNYTNLKKYFAGIFEQLEKMTSIRYQEKNALVIRNIRLKLVGDLKFESSAMNHPGQAASDSCIFCTGRWAHSGMNKATVQSFEFDRSGPLRTLRGMISAGYHPLLHIEPFCIVPPCLHLLMGLVNDYILASLLALANQIDFPGQDLPDSMNEQRMELGIVQKEEKFCQKVVESLQNALVLTTKIKEVYESRLKQNNIKRSSISCGSPTCCVSDMPKSQQDQDIFFCVACPFAIHMVCAGRYTEDQRQAAKHHPTACLKCQEKHILSNEEMIEHANEALDELARRLQHETSHLSNLKAARQDMTTAISTRTGPTKQKLEEVLDYIGCSQKINYQGLTGNQVNL